MACRRAFYVTSLELHVDSLPAVRYRKCRSAAHLWLGEAICGATGPPASYCSRSGLKERGLSQSRACCKAWWTPGAALGQWRQANPWSLWPARQPSWLDKFQVHWDPVSKHKTHPLLSTVDSVTLMTTLVQTIGSQSKHLRHDSGMERVGWVRVTRMHCICAWNC